VKWLDVVSICEVYCMSCGLDLEPLQVFFLVRKLWWSGPEVMGKEEVATSANKILSLCRSDAPGFGLKNPLFVRADVEKGVMQAMLGCGVDLWQGSSEAAPGSSSTIAASLLSSHMA
jgi:hypothetical protein